MQRIGEFLALLQHRWTKGVAILVCAALLALLYVVGAGLVLLLPAWLFGWSDSTVEAMLYLSCVIWLPLAVGTVWPMFRTVPDRPTGES